MKIIITVHMAWWWPIYRYGVVFVAVVMGAQPDEDKVSAVIRKALRMKGTAA